ncbi:MAG: hypothetical protein M3Q73_01625 [bacterium]|nr:hypothetical protein [bacterium]
MQKMRFTIEISASKEKVWEVLWSDKTFRDWASIIDESSYMVGEMKEGNEVQFISSVSGYGVTSLVEKLKLYELVVLRQIVDTKEHGTGERKKEWADGTESYHLTGNDTITTLTTELDVPKEQIETFQVRLPKALQRIKELTESM